VCSFGGPADGIEIYNLAGELMLRTPSPGRSLPLHASGCVDLEVGLLPRGTAFVKIYRGTEAVTERVVLE
jgi:hypothetical protein